MDHFLHKKSFGKNYQLDAVSLAASRRALTWIHFMHCLSFIYIYCVSKKPGHFFE